YFKDLELDPKKLTLLADTKYDRLLQSDLAYKSSPPLEKVAGWAKGGRLFIVGSAWPEDMRICAEAYASIVREQSSWRLLIVPHELGEHGRQTAAALCERLDLSMTRFSELEEASGPSQVLYVDRLGILTQLYHLADLAFVGGAMHHKVHNVLEP